MIIPSTLLIQCLPYKSKSIFLIHNTGPSLHSPTFTTTCNIPITTYTTVATTWLHAWRLASSGEYKYLTLASFLSLPLPYSTPSTTLNCPHFLVVVFSNDGNMEKKKYVIFYYFTCIALTILLSLPSISHIYASFLLSSLFLFETSSQFQRYFFKLPLIFSCYYHSYSKLFDKSF